MIERALEQIPGRAIVNSVNLEAGRDKLDRVVPLALAHGAALIALTIDEVGMAKTAQRKVEIAERIRDLCCEEHGLDPELLIFDCLTFTLTTGDEEWRPSAVETIAGIKAIKAADPRREDLAGRLQRVLRRLPRRARGAQLGVPAPLRRGGARPGDGQPQPHHALFGDLRRGARAGRRPRLQPPRGRARAVHRPLRVQRARRRRRARADPTEGMEPEEALHFHILRRRKEGVEDWIDSLGREDRRGADAQRRCCCRR